MSGLRGVAAGVLTLIVMQALGSGQGPAAGGAVLVWLSRGVERLLSPDVPGVPTLPGTQRAMRGASGQPGRAEVPGRSGTVTA